MRFLGKSLGGFLVAALLVNSAAAGRLGEIEDKASKKKSTPSSSETPKSEPKAAAAKSEYRGYDSASTSSFGSGTYPTDGVGESFLTAMFGALGGSLFGANYGSDNDYEEEGWAQEANPLFPNHTPGRMTMPYLRFDANWQYLDDDLDARDFHIEVGYKPFAFYGRHTVYVDHLPDADPRELTINQYYGMFRFGLDIPRYNGGESHFQIGGGVGVAQQMGNEEHSSWAVTVPVKYYYNDFIGIEFRPAWYRWSELMIGDYDASVSLGWRFLQGRLGYRWLWMQSEGHLLNGPYGGVSIAF